MRSAALIGPNGAGKTTLFNLLTGFDRADAGSWLFEGRSVTGLPAYRIARAGLVRTFQLTKSLTLLTVLENLKLARRQQTGERFFTALVHPLWRAREESIERLADEMLARFRLDRMRGEFAGTLSGGQRKLLELARALMVQPTMIMLDEPTAGVNPALTQSLLRHIQQLRDEGMTILFVNMTWTSSWGSATGSSAWPRTRDRRRPTPRASARTGGRRRHLGAHHGRRAGTRRAEMTASPRCRPLLAAEESW